MDRLPMYFLGRYLGLGDYIEKVLTPRPSQMLFYDMAQRRRAMTRYSATNYELYPLIAPDQFQDHIPIEVSQPIANSVA
jgi:hypothetical protein